MKLPLVVPIIVCCAVASAHAEVDDCEADLRALGQGQVGLLLKDVFPVVEGARLPPLSFEEGRCVVRDVALALGTASPYRQMVHANEVRWTVEWSDAARAFAPTRLLLEASGLWQGIESDEFDPTIAYQMRLVGEATPSALVIDYTYDPATERLDLRRFDIGTRDNGLSLLMTVEKLRADALTSGAASIDDVLALRPTNAEISLRNTILVETMTGAWLPLIYPQLGQTPDAAIAEAKRLAQTQLATVPGAVLPEPSQMAISAMIESLPHPTGELQLRMSAPKGLALSELAQVAAGGAPTWEDLVDALSGASLQAAWTPRTAD